MCSRKPERTTEDAWGGDQNDADCLLWDEGRNTLRESLRVSCVGHAMIPQSASWRGGLPQVFMRQRRFEIDSGLGSKGSHGWASIK
ncbi:hypothetical protein L596_015376 [Steinernema carpocapsae]|uniref:Uncharacterized protein n=1 Tax=Steinernema carpocapsae TaxID=34508 RepID=A0A4U5NES6_STECR|nr:hypothetical protein L596_015376 [Steinernema carpocapsae]